MGSCLGKTARKLRANFAKASSQESFEVSIKNHVKNEKNRNEAEVSLYKPLTGELSALALEPAQDATSIPDDLAHRIVSWESKNLPEDVSLIHLWADADLSIFNSSHFKV